jgi:hypothetical protein
VVRADGARAYAGADHCEARKRGGAHRQDARRRVDIERAASPSATPRNSWQKSSPRIRPAGPRTPAFRSSNGGSS